MKKAVVLSVLFCLIFSMTAQAKDVWQMAESKKYGEKAGGMIGRGLLNVVTCFVDIPVRTVKGAKEDKPEFVGAVGGFAKGTVCTISRAVSGVIDVATFWVPGFNGIPVNRKYDDCFAPRETAVSEVPSGYVPPSGGVYEADPAVVPAESRMKYVKK